MSENRTISIYINDKDLEKKLVSYNKTYDNLVKKLGTLTQGTKEYNKVAGEIEKYKKLIDQTTGQLSGKLGPTLKQLTQEQNRLNEALSRMPVELRKASAEAQKLDLIKKKIAEVKAEAAETGNAMSKFKLADALPSFTGNLAADGAQKLWATLKESFYASVQLSDQLADIRKTTGMTADEAQRLNNALSHIDTRTSMNDLREIAKVGGQFGVAKDQIYDFVKAVDITTVALGDEFSGGAEEVASEMSKLRNIFKDIKTDNVGVDIGFISNAINALASAGVATGPVVADLANRIGGYGIQVGLTSGQTLGLSATLQELGVSAERGGTAVTKILQKMLTNSEDFAKIAGVPLTEFKDLLNKDIYGAFVKVMEGSKRMGPNATELARVISELEVEGAGASEVFAKLGSNTDMLREKADLATESLTNTASIAEEFSQKNDNLAGAVENLGKEWDKMVANPSTVKFFKGVVDLTAALVGGIKVLIDVLSVAGHMLGGWFTGDMHAGAKERMRQIEDQKAQFEAEQLERERKVYNEQLAAYKQHVSTMTMAELLYEKAKKVRQAQITADYMKELQAQGRMEELAQETKWLKYQTSEIAALNKLMKIRAESNVKIEHEETAKEKKKREKEEKAAKRESDKKEKERVKELNRIWKLQVEHYDDMFKAAEKHRDEDFKKLVETNKKKWDALKDFYEKEVAAVLEYNIITAKSAEERHQAEIEKIKQTYSDKMLQVKEGSAQYLLLQAQMNKEVADKDAEFANTMRQARVDAAIASADNETELHDAKVEQIRSQYEIEMELNKANADKVVQLRAEMNKALKDEDERHWQAQIGKINTYGGMVIEGLRSLSDMESAIEENDLKKAAKNDEKEKARLKNLLDTKKITQEQYDAQIAALDLAAESRERESQKRRAESEKRIAVFEATLKAALAIFEAILNPFKIPQAVAAGIQAGVIAATPIPEFAKGTDDAPGGLALVGEEGPELVDIPKGSKVFTASKTRALIPNLQQPQGFSFSNMMEANNGIDRHATRGITSTEQVVVYKIDERFFPVIEKLIKVIDNGIKAETIFDDERLFKLQEKMDQRLQRDEAINF